MRPRYFNGVKCMTNDPIDPTNATRPDFSRRMFVGMSVATAAGAAATAHALGQTMQLGQPHAPLVPENDPSLFIEHVTLHTPNGDIDGYAARPKTTEAA